MKRRKIPYWVRALIHRHRAEKGREGKKTPRRGGIRGRTVNVPARARNFHAPGRPERAAVRFGEGGKAFAERLAARSNIPMVVCCSDQPRGPNEGSSGKVRHKVSTLWNGENG